MASPETLPAPPPEMAPATAAAAVQGTTPMPQTGPARVPPDIIILSRHIDEVMMELDRIVEESLKLQYSLLRLRLAPKHAPPDLDPAEFPIGL